MARALFLVVFVVSSASWCFATFSIVAIDPKTGEMGIAVASRVLAVGSQVGWAEADALVPDNSYFHIELGFLTYLVGQKDEALRHFQKARLLDSHFLEVWDTYRSDPLFKSILDDREFVNRVFELQ